MSEKTIQEALQVYLQGMAEFDDIDVTISNWSVLSKTLERAPLSIIEISDDFLVVDELGGCRVYNWNIPVVLVERFRGYDETPSLLRDRRQAILDHVKGDNCNLGPGAEVQRIRNDGPIVGFNPQKNAKQPMVLFQRIIVEVKEEEQ